MKQKPIPDALLPFLEGRLLFIDKPYGWTSFDIVKKVRYLTKVMKVGHAGTLDPLATGLLIIGTGRYTKSMDAYRGMQKEYTGTMVLGATTPTYDLESEPENFKSIEGLTNEIIQKARLPFIGEIFQIPPSHSAIKKEGRRLYESARLGIEVKADPRKVIIESFEITKIELPHIHFKVICSTGTYIRSLVKDFGESLKVGAYMSSLRRTRIGEFTVDKAQLWQDLETQVKALLEG